MDYFDAHILISSLASDPSVPLLSSWLETESFEWEKSAFHTTGCVIRTQETEKK